VGAEHWGSMPNSLAALNCTRVRFPWGAAEHAVAVDVILAFAPNYAAEV